MNNTKLLDEVSEALFRLHHVLIKNTAKDSLVSISLTPDAFDQLMIEAYRKGDRTTFKPSQVYGFELFGIRIKPESPSRE